jgi:hypothetical protein
MFNPIADRAGLTVENTATLNAENSAIVICTPSI